LAENILILISAGGEWDAIRELFPRESYQPSPYGEYFSTTLDSPAFSQFTGIRGVAEERGNAGSGTAGINDPGYSKARGDSEGVGDNLIFFHGGWGKIAAAASTEYAIGRWKPRLLINLGTCGGFEGEIERGEIVLVEKTIVYDIIEQMGDFDSHIAHYSTPIDLSWLSEPYPSPVRRSLLVSADRDLLVEDIPNLKRRYGAAAGDWESGAIAWVAARHGVRTLILRGVTDLVGSTGGEAYGNLDLFKEAAATIMRALVGALPGWIAAASK
jgi:adenosylhomocysteine nucleosidase